VDFQFSPVQRRLVEEVDAILTGPGADVDPRTAFAELGRRRLMAVHWPERYGGRGLALADHATVVERVGLHGLPDEVHLVTVQGVGCPLLVAGSEQQREQWLPSLAQGTAFASLLLSEPGAGSDLAAISTTAEPCGEGYVLTGEKTWNLHADWSSFGLCAARTRVSGNPYHAITALLVPFDMPGVSVEPVPRAIGDPFFRVSFDGVRVDRDAVVGCEHVGWPLLVRAIGFERAGFDYLTRARRWLGAARRLVLELPCHERRAAAAGLLCCERRVEAARSLAFRAVALADGLDMDEISSAYSKLACGEAAQHVAWWAASTLGTAFASPSPDAAVLRLALAEAPELSVSGGATELQLDLIATEQRTLGLS
jgi:alkylation response protein AidB-like acyl-CoA dehydrogenase